MLLYVLLDFHAYVMLCYCTFSWTSTHTSCYATVRSLGLPRIRHAMLLYVLFDFHAYVMLCYCTFSWTSTHTSCYATVSSLGLPRIRHAMLLYVLLGHAYVMLRYCTFSWTSTRTSCYATVRSLGLPRIRHATLLYVLLDFYAYVMLRYCTFSWTSTHTYASVSLWKISCQLTWFWYAKSVDNSTLHPSVTQYVFMWCWRSSLQNPDPEKVLGRTGSAAVNKRLLKNCAYELVGVIEEDPKMEVCEAKWLFSFFCLELRCSRPLH